MAQVRVCWAAEVQVPVLAVAVSRLRPIGRVSVRLVAVADDGPAFRAVSVYVTGCPLSPSGARSW